MRASKRYYEDPDGSFIRLIDQDDNAGIKRLEVFPPAQDRRNSIFCVLFSAAPSIEKNFQLSVFKQELYQMLLEEKAETGVKILGFDTEGKALELIQVGGTKRILLIHKSSGLQFSPEFHAFVSDTASSSEKRLFVGAEITGEALSLPLHGCLDLTPIFSVWLKDHREDNWFLPKAKFEMLTKYSENYPAVSLTNMVEKALNISWTKERSITMSDWCTRDLSLRQLKYATLDVWASAMVGRLALRHFSSFGVFKHVFSTHPKRMKAQLRESLKNYFDQSHKLESLQKTWKIVKVTNMMKKEVSILTIKSGEYANRPRVNSEVKILIQNPDGCSKGVCLFADVVNEEGKLSDLQVSPICFDEEKHKFSHESDLMVLKELSVIQDLEDKITQYWREWFDVAGEYNSSFSSLDIDRLKREHRSVSLMTLDDDDCAQRQVRFSISDFVRSHVLPRHEVLPTSFSHLPSNGRVPSTDEIARSKNLLPFLALTQNFPFPNSNMEPPGQGSEISTHYQQLNTRQLQALTNSLTYKVSAVKGPPGTGKTRTSVALAEVCSGRKERVLIIAPANVACRRVLESVVGAGFLDVCLLVSKGYFLEWHQSSYESSIKQYVHTRNKLITKTERMVQRSLSTTTAKGREFKDFFDRNITDFKGKWTELAMFGPDSDQPAPSVVIGTYGCFATAIYCDFSSRWGKQVSNVLQLEEIEVLVVDETSQIWDGYVFGLFCRLPNLKRIVFIGDEKQLAPFGEDRVKNMQSLFSAAISHPDVPCVQLNESFRLSPEVGSVISRNIYEGDLRARRLEKDDTQFRYFLSVLRNRMKSLSRTDCSVETRAVVKAMVHLLSRRIDENPSNNSTASLVWIHHASLSHTNQNTNSTGNVEEAELVARMAVPLIQLIDSARQARKAKTRNGIGRLRVVIITPYLEQKKILETELAKSLENFRGRDYAETVEWISSSLFVNTVDSFQGQEAEFVFLSMVRSRNDSPGFLKDQRRANVMLSRSSQMMVIVGDSQHSLKKRKSGKEQGLVGEMAKAVYLHGTLFSIDGESGELIPNDLVVESSAEIKTLSDSSVKKKWQKNTKSAVNKNTINNPTTVVGLENQKLGPLR